jgi:hypothetical protein
MTRAGKILLYSNLVLSLMMAAWGMALFYGRINWTDKEKSPDLGKPEYKKVAERIAELKPSVTAADERYRKAAEHLRAVQQQRAANRAWYSARMDDLREKATEQNPAIVPLLNQGLPVPAPANPQNAPIQTESGKDRSGEPLRSFKSYVDDMLAKYAEINTAMDALEQQNQKYLEVSKLIVGETRMDVGGRLVVLSPGLRQLLQDEQDKLENIMGEIERLRPLLVNSYVEIQLLAKRNALLLGQVMKLGGDGSAETAKKAGTGVDK